MTTYKCTTCGDTKDSKYIKAMHKAGYGLNHIACRKCGQHTIVIKVGK